MVFEQICRKHQNPSPTNQVETQKNIDYYTQEYDLPNLLPESDGTPLGLKALLFNRYDHWNGFMGGSREKYAQQFKEWYLSKYVANTKTHRQRLNQQ